MEKCKKYQLSVLLSKEEKDRLIKLKNNEHFVSISQFIRSRCLTDNITNSELTDIIMNIIGQKLIEEYVAKVIQN